MKKDERRAAWRSIRKYVLIVAAAILLTVIGKALLHLMARLKKR